MLGAEAAGYSRVARKGADLHEEEGLLLIDLLVYLCACSFPEGTVSI